MGGPDNLRLDPRAWCHGSCGSPNSKHELAGHQGVGESPPRAAVRRSKLNSFPLAKARIPPTNPLPGTVLAGPLVGLRFVEQFRYSETAGDVPPDLGSPLRPLSSLGSLFISITGGISSKVRSEVSLFKGSALDFTNCITPDGGM